MKEKSEMENINSILNSLIKKRNWEWSFSLNKLKQEWENIVNKNIANHSQPVFIKNKVLYIEVDSPIWSNELVFLKEKIIDKINGYYNKKIVTDIFFKNR